MIPRVALITGAGRGLGLAVARQLGLDGFKVACCDVDPNRANATAEILKDEGLTAIPIQLDVTNWGEFEAARDEVCQHWGGISVLVNNAAITKTTSIWDISPQEFDDVMAVNLRGVFFGCQVLGAHFRDQGYGRILNMSSLAGQNGGAATGAHYAASKGAIITLTKVFARELAAAGVTVNAIAPGPLDVEILPEILPADKIAALKSAIPVGHLGDPNFIGRLVALLVSDGASSVTGATFDANGGIYVR